MRFTAYFLTVLVVGGCRPLHVTKANVRVQSSATQSAILTDPAVHVYENDVRTHKGWLGIGPSYVTQELWVEGPVKLVPVTPANIPEALAVAP